MNDAPSEPGTALRRDAARIAAEIAGLGGGTDPFAAAVRATRMPMVVSDPRLPDNPIVFVNDSFCRLTGYAREEIVGRNCRFLQGPDTDPATVARIRAAVTAREPLQIEIRNHRRDGSAFWNRLLLGPVRDAAGEVAYFFASQMDVTLERERLVGLETRNAALATELAGRLADLEQSEARLRYATEAGRFGVWELDLLSSVLTSSPTLRDIFGYGADADFSHAHFRDATHMDDRAAAAAAFDASVRGEGDYDIECRITRPDGVTRWVQLRAQIVRDAGGPARMAGIALDITERREAERQLQRSEQSLRLATEAAEIGTWDLDLDTDELTWSDRTKAMFGISPGVACSMADFYAGLHPEDYAATAAAFADAVDPAQRTVYDVEYRTIGREDGVVRWVAAKGAGLFDGGRCIRALGTAIDITQRKRAERRQAFLLAVWDRLRAVTDADDLVRATGEALGRHLRVQRVGIGYVEPSGKTILYRTGFAEGVAAIEGTRAIDAFGARKTAQQFRGETVVCDDTFTGSDAADAWAALQTRAYVSVPLVRDGRFRACLFVNAREPRAWSADDVALVEDVATRLWDRVERGRAEAELRAANEVLEAQVAERTATLAAAEARMRTVFETSFQLQGFLTPEGIVIDVNSTALAVIGQQIEDVAGRPFWETPWFSETEGMPEFLRTAVAAAAAGKSLRREITVRVPAGLRTYDFAIEPVFGARAEVVALVPGAMDITERRQAEEALRQAQKMEAVGQLTGGIAHDFNNLLTGIIGSLELMARRIDAGNTNGLARYATAATTSAQRAAALTQRLLAFARRQPLDPKRVDANRLLAGMEELLARTIGPATALEMVFSQSLWPVLCDPNQLESAILNLAINARDAMADGGRLTIETANAHLDDAYARTQGPEMRAGQYVAVSVTDTGEGMTADVIERAFDPFFTTKPVGQGTGLGLSMLYGFVKQSDGHVRIYSEPGRGTTVKIYLPRLRVGAVDAGLVHETQPRPDAATPPEAGMTVLVVDDEATLRMLVIETLADLGYAALEAADGAAALRILQSAARVDLLVTDVGLPGLNGRQLADAARTMRPGLPVLFMTGYAHNAAIGTGGVLEPGMEIVTKPFALDALGRKVAEMLGG